MSKETTTEASTVREATVERSTGETTIRASVRLVGGVKRIDAPNAFFAHMLDALVTHSGLGVDLVARAEVLGRPIAVDQEESVASFGAETASHRSGLAKGIAPDFTLPDLSGKEHSLSSFKGKKVLLIAYASW